MRDLFVVATIHKGSNWCVRRANATEVAEERATGDGWAMPYKDAVALARETAREHGCRWFDFSADPAPTDEDLAREEQ